MLGSLTGSRSLRSANDPNTLSPNLIVQTSFLGDMVLTTPLIAELARRGPVDVVATPANKVLLANNPDVRNVIVLDKRDKHSGIAGFIRMTQIIGYGGYHTVYLAQGSIRSAALTYFGAIKNRVGFNTSAGKWFYTQHILYRDDLHHAARLLTLAGIDNPSSDQLKPRLYPGASEKSAIDGLNISTPFITLAPGSVWATKRWPYFAELASLLSKDFNIVIVGSGQDRAAANEILARVPNAIDTTGKLSLLASAELIRRSGALATNDSAPQHLASAMDTPTITMFGPTVPEFGFGPLAHNSHIAALENLPCRPCHRHGPQKCPLGHWRCMKELPVNYVYDVVVRAHESAPAVLNANPVNG